MEFGTFLFAAAIESLLTLFKVCLLLMLYLFMFRVLRAVWSEIAVDELQPRQKVKGPRMRSSAALANVPTSLRLTAPEDLLGQTYPLAGTLTVGRALGSTIWMEDSFLSHNHARFSSLNAEWFIEDLGSTNGTFLNDERVEAATTIHPGDTLRMGRITAVVE